MLLKETQDALKVEIERLVLHQKNTLKNLNNVLALLDEITFIHEDALKNLIEDVKYINNEELAEAEETTKELLKEFRLLQNKTYKKIYKNVLDYQGELERLKVKQEEERAELARKLSENLDFEFKDIFTKKPVSDYVISEYMLRTVSNSIYKVKKSKQVLSNGEIKKILV